MPGGKATPRLCGINSGQHIYVPASDQCNDINAIIGPQSNTRSLAIKVGTNSSIDLLLQGVFSPVKS